MQKPYRVKMTLIVMLLGMSTGASAESWLCEHGNLVREINVVRESGAPVPCSVVYNKDAEGKGSTVLWTASADGSYCDAKANGLAEKLEGFGWSCTAF